MNPRTALLAATLAVAALLSSTLRAEELQVTVSGVATCVLETCNPQTTPTGPFTVSYDVNTLSGTRTTFFQPNELGVFDAESLSITNYSEIVDGHTILSAPHTTGSFEFIAESRVNYQFTGGAGPPAFRSGVLVGSSFDFEAADPAVLTEAQFKAFKDPLADMLLLYRSPPGARCGVFCELLPSDLTLHGTMTVTPVPATGVPAPEPLSLFLAGLVGLVLSRRSELLGSLPLRS